jgi:putative transposase
MARPYSLDLRERALARVQAGESARVIARALSISASSVVKWSQRFRATGRCCGSKMGGQRPRLLAGDHADFLRQRIAQADFTLCGLVAEEVRRALSPSGPAVTSIAIGRPSPSTTAWIFVVRPPRASDPSLGSLPPFSAGCRAMRLGRGAIDDGNVVRGQFHQGAEQALPPSAHHPAMEPIVNRGRRPIDRRTILPATPRPEHTRDAANDAPVVHPRRARPVPWQRLNRRLRPSVQPEFPRMIQAPQFELES